MKDSFPVVEQRAFFELYSLDWVQYDDLEICLKAMKKDDGDHLSTFGNNHSNRGNDGNTDRCQLRVL